MSSKSAEYKDSFFRDLVGLDKDANVRFLDVVNAAFGTNLTLENAKIEDVSIDNVFYTKLRSDVAKIVNGTLIILLEHQSTINENMPLRMLEYAAQTYMNILNARDRYKMCLQKIPRPLFVVFYNGKADFPAEKTLRLSDAFMDTTDNDVMLELQVKVININLRKKCDILHKSSVLRDYSVLCANIEDCQKQGESDYVRAGILRTMEGGTLCEYLKRNITEAAGMLMAEYDYDTDMAVKKEEWEEQVWKKAMAQGMAQGMEQGYASGVAWQKAQSEKMIAQLQAQIASLQAERRRGL